MWLAGARMMRRGYAAGATQSIGRLSIAARESFLRRTNKLKSSIGSRCLGILSTSARRKLGGHVMVPVCRDGGNTCVGLRIAARKLRACSPGDDASERELEDSPDSELNEKEPHEVCAEVVPDGGAGFSSGAGSGVSTSMAIPTDSRYSQRSHSLDGVLERAWISPSARPARHLFYMPP